MRKATISATILLTLVLMMGSQRVFSSAGPLIEVTPDECPEHITVAAARLEDGSTRFEITLRRDGNFSPNHAFVQLRSGEELEFTTRVELLHDREAETWEATIWAVDKLHRDGRVLVSYGTAPGAPPVSRNWSIPFSKFAPDD